MRNYLILCLSNPEYGESECGKRPGRLFLDLEVTYRLMLQRLKGGWLYVRVDYHLMTRWGVDEEKLYEAAVTNMPRLFEAHIWPVDELLLAGPKLSEEMLAAPMVPFVAEPCTLYVLTGKELHENASLMCCPFLLRAFAEAVDDDFYIIPSSIREVLLIGRSSMIPAEELKEVLIETNRQEVPAGEVLSDRIYYYTKNTGKLSIFG